MHSLHLDSKLPTIGASIFSVMSSLAREHNAINLSQGFPDFSCDPHLLDLVGKFMAEGMNQYAPSHGLPQLRDEIARFTKEQYGGDYDPETEVTVTSGATEALFCALSAVITEGDEVILFEPAYDSYAPVIELLGGRSVYLPLEFPNYNINWDNVKKRVNSRTRMIILNSPHNPTGAALSSEDMFELQRIVKDNQIFILSDEVYEHILFDGKDHQSISRYPELASQSFIVSSFGKTFHVTGWKVGYCLAPEKMTKEFRKIHQFITFSTATPFQAAIAAYMKDRERISYVKGFYQEKRDFFQKLIQGSRFKALDCQGTYFQLLDYNDITDEPDVDFARRLTIEHKLAAIPVSVFYHSKEDNGVLRFCFAKENETLERAAEILHKL